MCNCCLERQRVSAFSASWWQESCAVLLHKGQRRSEMSSTRNMSTTVFNLWLGNTHKAEFVVSLSGTGRASTREMTCVVACDLLPSQYKKAKYLNCLFHFQLSHYHHLTTQHQAFWLPQHGRNLDDRVCKGTKITRWDHFYIGDIHGLQRSFVLFLVTTKPSMSQHSVLFIISHPVTGRSSLSYLTKYL